MNMFGLSDIDYLCDDPLFIEPASNSTEIESNLNEFLENAFSNATDHDYTFDPESVLFCQPEGDHCYQKLFDHEEVLEIVPPQPDQNSVPKSIQKQDHDYTFDPESVLYCQPDGDHCYQKLFDHEEVLEIVPPQPDQNSVPKSIQKQDHDYQVNWTEYMNENLICRLCMKNPYEPNVNYDVSDVLNKLKVVVPKKIVIDNEQVAKKICRNCLDYLNHFHVFVEQIKTAKKFFENEKTCLICSKDLTKDYNIIIEHVISNHKNHFLEIVPCVFCAINFKKLDDLKLHLEDKHNISNNSKTDKESIDLGPVAVGRSSKKKIKDSVIKPVKLSSDVKIVKSYKEIQNQYKCRHCTLKFTNENSLRVHLMRSHAVFLPNFKCFMCNTSYQFRSELSIHLVDHENHLRSSNEVEVQICHHCDEVFENEAEVEMHSKKLHGDNEFNISKSKIVNLIYKCEYCDAKFTDERILLKHKTEHRTNCVESHTFQCRYCDLMYTTFDLCAEHKLSHNFKMDSNKSFSKSAFFLCDICQNTYSEFQYLELHRDIQHRVTPIKHILCHICSIILTSNEEFDKHMISHSSTAKKQCNQCFQLYSTEEFDKHKVAGSDSCEVFDCHFCDKKYSSKCSFFAHVTTHEDDISGMINNFKRLRKERKCVRERFQESKKVICKKCKRRFFTEYQLKIHDQRQHNRLPMDYSKNQTESFAKVILGNNKSSMENNSDDTILVCQECRMTFTAESHLKQHTCGLDTK